MATFLMLLTIGLPWIGAICVWWIGDRRPRWQHILATGFSVAAGAASILLLAFSSSGVALRIPVGGFFGDFTLVPDGLGVFLAVIAAVVGSLAVIFSVDYMRGKQQLGRYYALILLFIGAMAGLGLSGSLLFMFVFWEITAFCSYALISFHNDDPKAVAGGIKALIVTQLGGIGLLIGALIIRSQTGNYQILDFLANAASIQPSILNLIAFGFLAAAVAKSAQVPLQTWLPDAMEAPTPVTALIHAATMVNAGVYLLARFYPAFRDVPGWATSVVTIGLLSGLLAALMALVANDIKRCLAYSTVSQLGYMVYAVGTGSVFASQFHLLSHSVFKALLFLSAGAVIHIVGTRDMREMGGLGRDMPFVRAVFVIGSLALVGLPIANGFFSKELILEGGLMHGPRWAYIGMLLGAGITACYTLRMVSMVFYRKRGSVKASHDAPVAMRISLGTLSLGVFTTWLLAGAFGELLTGSLPYHQLQTSKTFDLALELLNAPATWLALLVILLGFALWMMHKQLKPLIVFLRPLSRIAENRFGFEHLNQGVIRIARSLSSVLRRTQTGQLNWNIVGIVGGLGIVLALLTWRI
ncbi:MAG TPA: NADH-quinone oxidoreductase subunit L [Anaerolineae bacterium]|nr:NADH-quinone oxidoreductase subunit L [Anaerolineae bacterium]